MHLIRSKTGARFRRSGVAFAHGHWTAIARPTDQMLAEAHLECVEVGEGDIKNGAFHGKPVVGLDEAAVESEPETETENAPEQTGREAELNAMKMDELKVIAEPLGIVVAVGMKKTDLASAIVAAEAAKPQE